MKILMITDLYPPITVGGYEISCKETADELSRRGHDVIILTSKRGGLTRVESNIHRLLFFYTPINLGKLNINYLSQLRRRSRQFQWAFESRKNYEITLRLIDTIQPDLAFIWNTGSIGVGPVLAVQDCGIPKVFNVGDYSLLRLKAELCDDPNWIKRKFRATIMGLKDFYQLDLKHLLVVSRSLKQIYVEGGFPEQNIHVIPVGIHSNLILPIHHGLPHNRSNGKRLLFVGRIVPEKAPDVAINALGVLLQNYGVHDVKLDIIGLGSEEYMLSLKNMASELSLKENVNFWGWLEQSQILDMYPDYDALLFTSRWNEPFGKTVLEAMARGLPVIASKRGGPLEIIINGENGLLVPPDEPVALAEAILQLLQNEDLTQKIRVAGINTIVERFTLENIVDKNLEYIQTLLVANNLNKAQKAI